MFSGAIAHLHFGSARMENFSAMDPRKQELLEARLLGSRVSNLNSTISLFYFTVWLSEYANFSLSCIII